MSKALTKDEIKSHQYLNRDQRRMLKKSKSLEDTKEKEEKVSNNVNIALSIFRKIWRI